MRTAIHKLYEREDSPYFTSYLLENSAQYQTGKKRPAVIICPGGGYLFLSDREAEPIAMAFLQKGFHAFVLHYTIGTADGQKKNVIRQALLDLAVTVKTVRENAEAWFIDPDKIVTVGFSAGAHLSSVLSVHWQEPWLAEECGTTSDMLYPNAVVLAYPLCDFEAESQQLRENLSICQETKDFLKAANTAMSGSEDLSGEGMEFYDPIRAVNEKTPPTFLWHTANDDLVFVENSLNYAGQLSKHKVPFELHVFEAGSHGLALANEVTASSAEEVNGECQIWIDLAYAWLAKHNL